MAEMANSEHADLLLCHVDKLEKDRASLQTVLDLKGQELTQLRSRMNEQVFQVRDVNLDFFLGVENHSFSARRPNGTAETYWHGGESQSRSYLSTSTVAVEWEVDLTEDLSNTRTSLFSRSVIVERDALREQIVQLERDNLQLTFANEIFLYRARERTASTTGRAETPATAIPPPKRPRLRRTPSFPFLPPVVHENTRLIRSVSLNGISDRWLNCFDWLTFA